MNRKRIVTAVLSSILALGAFAPSAFAGDWDRDHDRRDMTATMARIIAATGATIAVTTAASGVRTVATTAMATARVIGTRVTRTAATTAIVSTSMTALGTTAPARRRVRTGPVASGITARSMW